MASRLATREARSLDSTPFERVHEELCTSRAVAGWEEELRKLERLLASRHR